MPKVKHTWIERGAAVGQIVIAHTAWDCERFAAEELARYFAKITGVALPIAVGVRNRARPSIIILDASRPAHREFLTDLPLARLRDDGFIIQSAGADIFITSREPSGLVFGMYQYLTRVLGVTFYDYGPEGEDIPYADTVAHAPVTILKNPRLRYRGLQSTCDIRRIDWMIKHGFNWTRFHLPGAGLEWWDRNAPLLAPELKKRGIKIAVGHHTFDKIIREEFYLADHPDYFPLVNGRRQKQDQFSWSLKNPRVLDEVVCVLEDFLTRHPEIDMFDFWPADGKYQTDAEDFRAITGGEEPARGEWEKHVHGRSPTGRLGDPNKAKIYALLVKPVAEALARRFPKLILSTLNYVDLVQPCPDVPFPDNVATFTAIYWRCIKHTLLDDRCVYNSQFKKAILETARFCGKRLFAFYEYYMGMGAHVSLPYPCLTSLFGEWNALIKLGVGGAHIQSADDHPVPYNINYLAFAALAWDDLSRDEFLKTYCRGFFGAAGADVERMYQLWEARVQQSKTDTQPGAAFMPIMFSRETVVESRRLLDHALQQARDPKVIYRLARLIMLVEYTRLALAPGVEAYLQKAQDQRVGKPTGALDRQLLPYLESVAPYVWRLMELRPGIVPSATLPATVVPPENLAKKDVIARQLRNNWDRAVGLLRKQEWALKAFDPNVGEAELARRARKSKK